MIIVDDRERASGIINEIEAFKIPYKIEHLVMGDYIINDYVYVERKTVDDFLMSLKDGRLFEQVAKLRRAKKRTIIILEGKRLPGGARTRGVLCSLAVKWCVPVLRSVDLNGSAWILNWIYKQKDFNLFSVHEYNFIEKRRITNQQKRMLTQLRGVGPDLANNLIKHFGSIFKLLNATEEEILKVKGAGKYIAKLIMSLRYED